MRCATRGGLLALAGGSAGLAAVGAMKQPLARTGANVQLLLEACGLRERASEAARKMKGRLVLGLDINTTSTGYAVVQVGSGGNIAGGSCSSWEGGTSSSSSSNWGLESIAARAEVREWGRMCLKDTQDVLEGGQRVHEGLVSLRRKYQEQQGEEEEEEEGKEEAASGCWDVGVEDFAMSYTMGRFNTKGLFKLAQLSGIVKFSCSQSFGSTPQEWHPTSARAFYGLRKTAKEDVKKVVFDYVNKVEPVACEEYEWELLPNGSFSKDNYDVTDAYLIASYTVAQKILGYLKSDEALMRDFEAAYFKANEKKLQKAEARHMERAQQEVNGGVEEEEEEEEEEKEEKKKKKKKRTMAKNKFNASAATRVYRNAERKKLEKLYEEALEAWIRGEPMNVNGDK